MISDERARELRRFAAQRLGPDVEDLLDDREELLRDKRDLLEAMATVGKRIKKLERVVAAAREVDQRVLPKSENSPEFDYLLTLAETLRALDEEKA